MHNWGVYRNCVIELNRNKVSKKKEEQEQNVSKQSSNKVKQFNTNEHDKQTSPNGL